MDSQMNDPRGLNMNFVFQSQSMSQTTQSGFDTSKKSKRKSVEIGEKASWDAKTTTIFIKLCVDELMAGNRPESHFNKYGWDKIVQKFANVSQRNYNRIQLKNHWDTLKKEFGHWKKLLHNETGLGWNSERGTVEASPEWWERKLQVVPEAAKFRDKGPIMLKEQEMLFSDVVANGNSAYTPSSGLVPPHMEDELQHNLQANHVDESDNLSLSDIEVNQSTDFVNLGDQGTQVKRGSQFIAPIRHKKSKKITSSEKIAKCLERMMDSVEKKPAPPSTHENPYSIQACLETLEKMHEIEEGGKLWMFAARLFLKPTVRELFINIKKDQFRVKWLEEQMERDLAHKAFREEKRCSD